jgi:hypothetical protein
MEAPGSLVKEPESQPPTYRGEAPRRRAGSRLFLALRVAVAADFLAIVAWVDWRRDCVQKSLA